jgi:hypothetical protein
MAPWAALAAVSTWLLQGKSPVHLTPVPVSSCHTCVTRPTALLVPQGKRCVHPHALIDSATIYSAWLAAAHCGFGHKRHCSVALPRHPGAHHTGCTDMQRAPATCWCTRAVDGGTCCQHVTAGIPPHSTRAAVSGCLLTVLVATLRTQRMQQPPSHHMRAAAWMIAPAPLKCCSSPPPALHCLPLHQGWQGNTPHTVRA